MFDEKIRDRALDFYDVFVLNEKGARVLEALAEELGANQILQTRDSQGSLFPLNEASILVLAGKQSALASIRFWIEKAKKILEKESQRGKGTEDSPGGS